MSPTRYTAIAALAAASLAVPASAHAAGYTYTTIASGSETRTLGRCPAINLVGQVAFTAQDFNPQTFDTEDLVLRGMGASLTTIATESGNRLAGISGNPSISDTGHVAFDAIREGGGEVILRGWAGPPTEIARAGDGERFDSFSADLSLNSQGRVAFTGELANGDEGLFEGSGGPVSTRYLASTSEFAGSLGQPSLTEVETIAFTEETDAGVRGVFRQEQTGRITQLATGDFNGRVSLSMMGRVAFNDFDRLYLAGFGPTQTVATTAGAYSSFGFGGPSLNDRNQVAFLADLDAGGNGVFTGPDPIRDAVVRTGTVIGSRTVDSVSACREMLNAPGQVTATVFYADGTHAVIRADPR
jgi:hypothetical protein